MVRQKARRTLQTDSLNSGEENGMNRRTFFKAMGTVSASVAAGLSYAQQVQRYDILIKNGEVRDPGRGFKSRSDVAILGGRIAAIETNIPADRALDVIDAKGLTVTPGLIDLHTHCFWGGSGI